MSNNRMESEGPQEQPALSLSSAGTSMSGSPPSDIKRVRFVKNCHLASRKNVLRIALLVSLLAAASMGAGFAYKELRDSEVREAEGTFESVAKSAMFGAQEITKRKLQSSEVMSTWISWTVPDADSWPMININGYIPIANSVASLTSSTSQSLMAFVQPEEVVDFEAHTQQVYADQGRPDTAGVSDFGFGIWKPDNINSPPMYDDKRLHDSTGENDWGGLDRRLSPLMMHNKPGAGSLMYNLYSEKDRGMHIDSMVECAREKETDPDSLPCYAMTDFLQLKLRPGPAALLFQPIYPANDPQTFVGFATTSLHWAEVLTSTVPDYVSGLTCVISTESKSYTYEIVKGVPVLVGEGDLHDSKYEKYRKSAVLNGNPSGAKSSATYTLKVYPEDKMFETYITNTPLKVALSFVGAITLCSVLFCLYDFLMMREVHERSMVLEMKRRFVRFISHEIRTPLNTVCVGLELLEKELGERKDMNDAAGGKEAERLEKGLSERKGLNDATVAKDEDMDLWYSVTTDVRENANVAVSILNDLLNYDKLETGAMKLECDKVDIWELLARTVQQFQIQAVNRNVELTLKVEKPNVALQQDLEEGLEAHEVLHAFGDDVRLCQVLRNLISNALKFTQAGGAIAVAAHHVPLGLMDAKPAVDRGGTTVCFPRSGSIRIRVDDSGVGLTEQQLAQLFAEGVQFDANKLQHGGGSGLGLSIAKGIVEQHHGRIWAESEGVGTGTSFFVELPLYAIPLEDQKMSDDKGSTATGSSDTSETTGSHSPMRILVAEDAASSRKMLIRLLERSGYVCVPAVNGQEAVDAIKADLAAAQEDDNHVPIETILMDFEMPLMKGPEAAKEIRNLGYRKTIIGVTGNVLDEDVDFFKSHGADDVLPKPISLKQLQEYWDKERKH